MGPPPSFYTGKIVDRKSQILEEISESLKILNEKFDWLIDHINKKETAQKKQERIYRKQEKTEPTGSKRWS